MTILSITNPMALPALPEAAQDPGIQAQKPNPVALAGPQRASSGGGEGNFMFRSQQDMRPFQRPQDATSESVMDAQIAEQTNPPQDGTVVDTIQATRDTAAALPIPIPTAPALRDMLEQAAEDAAEQDVQGARG